MGKRAAVGTDHDEVRADIEATRRRLQSEVSGKEPRGGVDKLREDLRKKIHAKRKTLTGKHGL